MKKPRINGESQFTFVGKSESKGGSLWLLFLCRVINQLVCRRYPFGKEYVDWVRPEGSWENRFRANRWVFINKLVSAWNERLTAVHRVCASSLRKNQIREVITRKKWNSLSGTLSFLQHFSTMAKAKSRWALTAPVTLLNAHWSLSCPQIGSSPTTFNVSDWSWSKPSLSSRILLFSPYIPSESL